MVKKLTIKSWTSSGLWLAVCLVLAIAPLCWYGPSVLALLQGRPPLRDEPVSNIYGMSAIGLIMLVVSVWLIIRSIVDSVGKNVERFLAAHPEVTMAQLDQEFDSAEKIGNMWFGQHRTFSHDMRCVVVENTEIVRAYTEGEHSKRTVYYYICLELKNGKTERVKTEQEDLSEVLNHYRKYPDIRIEWP
ncbi:MAG: hypothetical protein NC420_15515 [Eubacterium sp.]|nr:hypothetical protein [Eubacterium sp.]MCM1214249.1 hypothetical protein [Lachnospiraceae bacterium]MCM1238091.1 hypothetical protein [Lachnospiraceae bacterium]